MEERDMILQKVKQALWQFRTPVVLPHGIDPVMLWETLLSQEPILQAYIKDIRMTAIPEGGYLYHIQYMNTQIPEMYVFLVHSQADLCQRMANMAARFVENFVAVVAEDVDPQTAAAYFHLAEACMYPNLKATSLTTTQMQGSGYWVCTYTYTYRIPREILIERDWQVEQKLDELVTLLIDKSASWRENTYAIYDFLTSHITYACDTAEGDVDVQSVVQSAYGALVQGSSVCQGMAEVYARLLAKANIPCRVVCGHTSDGTRHAWNVVQDEQGHWGHHDLTWGIMRPYEKGLYFHADDQTMAQSRTWEIDLVPKCEA